MGALILPQRLLAQSQYVAPIDWRHPLARDLVLAVQPGVNRGYDAVAGRLPAVTGTKVVPTSGGLAAGFGAALGAGTSDRIATTLSGAFPANGRSYFFRARRNGSGGGSLGRFFDKTSGGTGQFLMWYGAVARITYGFYSGSAERNVQAPGTNISAAVGETFDVLVTHSYDGASSNVINIYVNGVPVLVDSTVSGALQDAPAVPVSIGNRADNLRVWDGLIECAYVWDRILSPAEAAAIGETRYQLTRAPSMLIGTAPASGPAPAILIGAESTQETIGGTGGIGQTQNVAGATGTTGNQADTGGVGQVQSVAGSGSAQANAGDAGVIVQAQHVAGAIGIQDNTGGAGSIGQAQILAGAAGTQSNEASVGAVTVEAPPVPDTSAGAPAQQDNIGGTGTISQVQHLAGSVGEQDNEAGAGGIEIAASPVPDTLIGASGQQGNIGGTGAIGQVLQLAGAEGAQANLAGIGMLYLAGKACIYIDPGERRVYDFPGEARTFELPAERRLLTPT